MSHFFTVCGSVLLVFCSIWAYLWLEIIRDPHDELSDFYEKNPITKLCVQILNRIWIIGLFFGVGFLFIGMATS